MRVARCVGLDVARTEIIFVGEHPCLLVERFDRSTDGERHLRLHQEDLCQALGVPPGRKYQGEGGPGLPEAFELVRDVSVAPGPDVLTLVRATIANFLLGNGDAHAKNFALLYGQSGLRLGPLYDIVCTAVYPDVDGSMAMSIGANFDPDSLAAEDLQALAVDCGLNFRELAAECRRVAVKAVQCAKRTADLMRVEELHAPIVDRVVAVVERRAEQIATAAA